MDVNVAGEGLIEPSDTTGSLPNYLCVAWSLTTVIPGNRVILQVMNISPSLIKIYKGMKLAQIIPKQNILVVDQSDMETQGSNTCVPEINMDSSLLSSTEKTKLLDLLSEYSDVFATVGTSGAQNHIVKHTIKTTGLPIRQPLRRMPVTLKETVDKEVTKMLENRIIRPSASPWSSPVVMVKRRDGSYLVVLH